MGADDEVSIALIATVDQLTAGLATAREAMKTMADSMKEDLAGVGESSKEMEGTLKEVLGMGVFLEAKEIAKESLEAIRGAFEDTVGSAEKFGLSTAKFASLMGTSEEHAAGLSAALENVGSSTDTYESIAIRLAATLEKAGGASQELKDQFKDANGNFLSGADLMDRLKTVTDSYEEGAARTAVTTALLGKRTKDYYDISRVTAEAADRQSAIYRSMGVDFATLGEKSRQLEDAEGDLRTAWKAESVVIGQDLMPVAMAAMQWLGGDGKELLKDLETGVKFLMAAFLGMKVAVVDAIVVLAATFIELWDAIKLSANLVTDVTMGNWGAIKKDMSSGAAEMSNDFSGAIKTMSDEAKGLGEQIQNIFDPAKPTPAAAKHPGKAAPHDIYASQDKKPKADKGEEQEIQAAEKLALAEIAIDESTNAHMLAMGKESLDAFLSNQRDHENNVYAIKLAALSKEYALEGQTALQKQKILDSALELEATHQNDLIKIDQDGESKRAAAARTAVAEAIKNDDERLKAGIIAIDQLAAAGQIGSIEKAKQEATLTLTIRQEQITRLTDEINSGVLGLEEYKKAIDQRRKLEEQLSSEKREIRKKERTEIEADVRAEVTAWSGPFKSAINDMVFQAKSFQDAMKDLGIGIAQSFVTMCEQIAEKWLVTTITNEIVGKTAAIGTISANAGVAASAAASSQAGIPIVGPALAAAAAAETAAMVLGYESLASAAGGMVLDRDRLVYAHKDEMVLPANLSRGVQNMIGGQGGAGGAAGNSFTYSPTVHPPQNASLDSMLREQGSTMMAWLAQKQRDGAFRR